ncbi:nucleolin [Tanacetum coccineum]
MTLFFLIAGDDNNKQSLRCEHHKDVSWHGYMFAPPRCVNLHGYPKLLTSYMFKLVIKDLTICGLLFHSTRMLLGYQVKDDDEKEVVEKVQKEVHDVEEEVKDEDVGKDEEGDVLEGEIKDPMEELEPEEEEHVAEDHVELVDANEQEHYDVFKKWRKRKEFEIFVGGLDKDATEEDLRKIFSAVGDVAEVRLMMNAQTKKNKRFVFLRFATVNEKQCGVSPSQDSDTLFLGNICKTWTKEALKEKLKYYGINTVEYLILVEDKKNDGTNQGFAFLEFSSHSNAMDAFKRLQKRDVTFGLDRPAMVCFADSFIDPGDEIVAQVKCRDVFISSDQEGLEFLAVNWRGSEDIDDPRFYEPIQWKKLSHISTAPVKYDPQWAIPGKDASYIVTGAQLHVKKHDSKSILHLRLLYSRVSSSCIVQSSWTIGQINQSARSSGFMSVLSTTLSGNPEKELRSSDVVVDSGIFPNGPPVEVATPKLLKFVDMTQVCRGPRDNPGHWLVTGAKLDMNKGKIRLLVKFSLLNIC